MSKYPALVFFKTIYSLFGYLAIGGGVLFSLFILMIQDGLFAGVIGMIISVIVGASILVTAELLALLMDVEQHLSTIRFNQERTTTTRQTSNVLASSRPPAPSVFTKETNAVSKLGKFDPPRG